MYTVLILLRTYSLATLLKKTIYTLSLWRNFTYLYSVVRKCSANKKLNFVEE